MNAAIDEAAASAGRRPEEIRRLLNVSGSFGGGSGFLDGPPSEWARQLAELTLTTGMSTYIMAVSSADDLRRFAEEVAPAVRELVADARGAPEQDAPHAPPAAPAVSDDPAPLAAHPTPVPERAEHGARMGRRDAARPAQRRTRLARTPAGEQAAGRHLIDVHDALRAELAQLRDLVEQVAAGTTNPPGGAVVHQPHDHSPEQLDARHLLRDLLPRGDATTTSSRTAASSRTSAARMRRSAP